MDRRTFLITAAAATAAPIDVQDAGFVAYTPGAIDAALGDRGYSRIGINHG